MVTAEWREMHVQQKGEQEGTFYVKSASPGTVIQKSSQS